MTFEIEKNVPMPEPWRKRGSKYPVETMHIGDSFLVPGKYERVRSSLLSLARRISAKTLGPPIRLSFRTEGDSVRVWRTH